MSAYKATQRIKAFVLKMETFTIDRTNLQGKLARLIRQFNQI